MDTLKLSFFAIIVASLTGSLHCAGMCGGFVTYNTMCANHKLLANLFYNIGRLTTYLALGFLAGLVGAILDDSVIVLGIGRLASLLVGLMLIVWGLKSFVSNRFVDELALGKSRFSKGVLEFYQAILNNKYSLSESNRSFALGALTTLLPCGWLYSFVAFSAAAGNPIDGSLVMLAFWLGSLPALGLTAVASKLIIGKFGKYLPKVSALIVILAGVFSLLIHFDVIQIMSHDHHQHHGSMSGSDHSEHKHHHMKH